MKRLPEKCATREGPSYPPFRATLMLRRTTSTLLVVFALCGGLGLAAHAHTVDDHSYVELLNTQLTVKHTSPNVYGHLWEQDGGLDDNTFYYKGEDYTTRDLRKFKSVVVPTGSRSARI